MPKWLPRVDRGTFLTGLLAQPFSPEKRAVGEALLERDENGSEDNPALTLLFSTLKTAAPRTSSAAV